MYRGIAEEPVKEEIGEGEEKKGAEGEIEGEKQAWRTEEALKMLTVTPATFVRLKEDLRAKTMDPELSFRLVISPARPNQLKLVTDKEREGDYVIECEGVKILLISPEVASVMSGMVLDYQETPEGSGFNISQSGTG